MATIQEITQRIAAANAESKRLNNERNVNLGKKETLTAQLNNALVQYSQQYGVQLTVDNLQNEMQRVLEEKERETSNIENMLALIKEGKYEEAELVANPKSVENVNEESLLNNTNSKVEPTNPLPNLNEEIVEPTNPLPNLNEEIVEPTNPLPNLNEKVVEPTNPLPNLNEKVVEPTNPLPNLNEKVVESTNPLPNLSEEIKLPNLSEEIKLPNLKEEIKSEKNNNVDLPNLSEEVGMSALQGFKSGEPVKVSPVSVKENTTSTSQDLSGVTNFDAILGGTAFDLK